MKIARKKLSQRLINFSLAVGFLAGSLVTNLTLPTAFAASPSDVWITEAMPNPGGTDSYGEYILLENKTANLIDVSGWSLDDGGSAGVLAGSIAAGDTYKVCRDTGVSSTAVDCDEEWSGMVLNNGGDTITLRQNSMIIDTVTYNSSTEGNPVLFATHVAAGVVNISNSAELRDAIENQVDGQTWNIQPGEYEVSATNEISAGGQTGWYFPIVANDLTINGVGNPTIYGTGFSANGAWHTQDLVAVFGDNVTIDGMTFMPKVEPNKTIEVLGENFTLRNTVIKPNTLTDPSEYSGAWADADQWGGSLYFNHAGNHTIENVTINNSGISYRYAPAGTHITFTNVKIVHATNVDWINEYRYSSSFNEAGNTVTGTPQVIYRVNSTLNNFKSVLGAAQDGDVIELDSDYATTEQLTIKTGVTINGNGHTIDGVFVKTSNSNNSVLGVQSDDVTISDVIVTSSADLPWPQQLHGVNVYESDNVTLNNINAHNFEGSGFSINGSLVNASNLTTSSNGWHGINADNGSTLNISGVSSHGENSPLPISDFEDGVTVPHIFIDDANDGVTVVNDLDSQYMTDTVPFRGGTARVYTLDTEAPIAPATIEIFKGHNSNASNLIADGGYTNDRHIRINWDPSPDSDVDYYWLGTQFKAHHKKIPAGTTHYDANMTPGHNPYYYTISAVDHAGNESSVTTSYTINLDLDAPEASDIVVNGQAVSQSDVRAENCTPVSKFYIVNGEIDLSATLTDATSSVATAKYKVRKVTDSGCTVSNIFSSGNVGMLNTSGDAWEDVGGGFDTNDVPSEGKYTIYLQLTDSAGNTTTKYVDILVDNTAPDVQITSPVTNGELHNSDLQVRATITDENMRHYWYQIKKNGSVIKSQTVLSSGVTNKTLYTLTESGEYTITVAARDLAGGTASSGNRSMDVIKVVVIDKNSPFAEITSPLNGALVNGIVDVLGLVSEDYELSHYNLSLYPGSTNLSDGNTHSGDRINSLVGWDDGTVDDSGTNVSVSRSLDTTLLADGTYQLRLAARDAAGNRDISSVDGVTSSVHVVSFTVDNTAPAVTLVDVTVNGNVITPNITADDLNGPLTFTWTANDPQSATNVTISDDTVLNPDFTVNADGAYSFDVTVTDSLGNSHTETFSFTYTTPTPPSTGGNDGGDDTNTGGGDVNDGFTVVAFQPATPNQNEGDDEEVLGAQDQNDENANTGTGDEEVLGTDTSADKDSGWAPFGIMWYWWILILAAVGAFAWWLGRRFRQDESA